MATLPYFKKLADEYSMSDNFHQSVNGGTGANHIMLGHGDMIWFSDGNGHPAVPPHNQKVAKGTANAGVVDEVENPNPGVQAPTTGTWKTATVADRSDRPPSAAVPTRNARYNAARRCTDREVSAFARAEDSRSLPGRTLLSAEQLQPRLLRQRQQRLHG